MTSNSRPPCDAEPRFRPCTALGMQGVRARFPHRRQVHSALHPLLCAAFNADRFDGGIRSPLATFPPLCLAQMASAACLMMSDEQHSVARRPGQPIICPHSEHGFLGHLHSWNHAPPSSPAVEGRTSAFRPTRPCRPPAGVRHVRCGRLACPTVQLPRSLIANAQEEDLRDHGSPVA